MPNNTARGDAQQEIMEKIPNTIEVTAIGLVSFLNGIVGILVWPLVVAVISIISGLVVAIAVRILLGRILPGIGVLISAALILVRAIGVLIGAALILRRLFTAVRVSI